MIEQFFERSNSIERHRRAPVVGPYLDSLVEQLAALGYSPSTIRGYVYAWEQFGRFLAKRGVGVRDVDDAYVEAFLRETATRRTWRGVAVDATGAVHTRRPPVTFLLARLRPEGVAPMARRNLPSSQSAQDDVLAEYLTFLRQHRGIQECTIGQHCLHVRRFLRHVGDGIGLLPDVTVFQIDSFLIECGQRMSRRSVGRVSSALRSFFRYLHLSGRIDRDLSSQITAPRVYALESVPRGLPWTDVLKVLAAPERSTVAGRRDYAILLLLAVCGLRASEVAGLSLDDIDWRADRLRIRRSKDGLSSWYPLHSEVGEAIAGYLRRGRPATLYRQVFLTLTAPFRPFSRSSPVSNVVSRHLRRAGVEAPHCGAHTLRHAHAVHLLQQGFSLRTIGELLGHRHPQSTYIYTKAALDDLRCVGLEVTEMLP